MARLARMTGIMVVAGLGATGLLQGQNMPMGGHDKPMAGQECPMGTECKAGQMDPEMMAMMQEMQGMMEGMMAVHAYDPAKLLQKKADLSLTPAQLKTLEALVTEVKIAKDHAKSQHDVAHARVLAEFKLAKPDPSKVKAAGQEAMQDKAAAHGIELSAMARAKGLLTDAQRAKVDEMMMDHAAHH